MTGTVTAGLDGSPQSIAAAHWAAREAALRRDRLHLVHADDWPTTAVVRLVSPDEQRRWSDTLLSRTSDELRKRHPGLEVTTGRLPGRPAASLPAEASKAEMLVIGSRRLTGMPGSLIGSVSMATISATERPVVLVRATSSKGKGETGPGTGDEPVEGTGPYRDVVVGVDIDHSCDGLLAFAFDEAAQRGCTLQVVHAWSLPLGFSYAPALDPGIQSDVERRVAQTLSDLLLPWREEFPSVNVVEKAVVGPVAQHVLYAAALADLVVVGRRIRRSPVGAHIGHVAHAVMHHADAPVAVVAHR
ncbi:universal stress protein [Streptomyces lunaelactis]|uniref:Universal stress protein n=1 Tax=Streptomyces lunaelactis TaxID=1535768 RepID=A0A2R4TC97_9ACTN|nr:universal stress protein [Streptomyces lunaelactis]AVZ76711.1 universal stress protein [Streptomyces lunaelactis]NUK89433.1 universal stress protein [Streptomyces lunaelactis]